MERIDLHLHTNVSDGVLSPEEVIQKAVLNGCSMVSITDHEIINDYSSLAKKYGIEIVPGIEFNTAIRNMHILGYGIKDLERVSKFMLALRLKNEQVCFEVLKLLEQGGIDISLAKLRDFLKRNHYDSEIIDKRKIVKYLIYKGYVSNVLEAYKKLIGVHTEFYVPNYKIEPESLIELVQSSGGIVSLAHPNTLNLSEEKLLEEVIRLKRAGLAGIEVVNKKISMSDTVLYSKIADKLDLIKTIGSDFHDPKNDSLGIEVKEEIKEEFIKRLTYKK